MAQELPTADEFFGPKPLPTADEFFAPPQRGSLSSDALGNPAIDDEYLSHSTAGYVLDKFGQGFKDGWGTRPLGLSKESDDWLKRAGIFNDVDSGRTSLLRSFNEQLLRPTATALDLIFNRVPNALYHGTGDVALAAGVPRDIVALPEAFPAGHLSGMPTTPALPQAFARAGGPGAVLGHEFGIPEIERAADLGVIGKGEAGYKGLPTPEDLAAQQEAVNRLAPENGAPVARPVSPQPFGPDQVARPVYTEPVGPQAPDLHGAARQIAPDLFAEYDALAQQKEALVSTLGDLADMRDRGTSPALDALDRQIDDLRGQRLEAPASERAAIADRVTALETERATLANELPKTGDTADMAAARQQLVDTDYRMRDLAPDVSAAYRDAAEGATPEPTRTESPAEAVAPGEAAPEPEPPTAAEQPLPDPGQIAPETAATPPAEPVAGGIAGDVAKQLVAAGRPAEEANAAGALVEVHYEARAANLRGASAESLYRDEAPSITTGRGTRQTASPDLQVAQSRRGKIRLATDQARATITLFKDADASTFIHETGHAWLEELIRDAGDQRATDQVRSDAATVREWLGVTNGAEIPRQAHEKFARGFERYMMEGHAPSAALAGVFAKFRDWLTRIYKTVAELRSPINDDIRGVFDRMLATKDEQPVIAPGEPTRSFADIHEADAAATEPPRAGDAAETVRDERDKVMEAAHPEIEDERLAGRAPSGADGGSAAGGELSRPSGPAPEPDALPARGVSQRSEVGAGRSDAAAEGNRAPAGQRSAVPDGANRQFEPADGLIDRAGNIRLDNLSQPADVDAVIRDAAERNAGFIEQRRGTITDGQMLDLADALGVDPAFLDDKKIGQAFSAEEILAARKLLVQSASAVRDAMLRAADGRPENLAALAQAIARHEMIQGKVAQATAEWGRAGRAFRNLDGWQQARDLNQFLKQNGGRDLNQLSMMARLGKFLQTPGQISKLVTDTAGGKVKQAIVYYWVNTLISGPITHMTYSVGNMLNALWTPLVETPLAAASGAVRDALGIGGHERVYFNEVSAQLYGLGKGFRDGLGAALGAWKSGVTPPLPGEKVPAQFTAPQISPIPGRIGQALGLPGKAVSSIHAFFKFMRYEQNIQALAARDALGKGLDGTARDLHVAKLTASPTSEMMEAAAADALKELYMRRQPYGSAGAQLSRLTNSWLPLKIIAPFVKIGSEIVRNAFAERTPLGLAIGDVRGNLLMREGGAAFDMQLGKVMAGTGLMAATVGAVLGGLMTGDGPSDPNERRVWLLNHKPNSIGVGPLWFSYARLGHLAMLMRFGANMTESGERWNETEGPKLAHAFFDGISRSVLDETWMRGVKDFFDAIYHSEEYFDRWLPRFVAQWTPFSIGLGQVARLADPYQRETRDLSVANEIFNEIHSHIPMWSRSLMPRRDIFGEPITTGSGTVDRYAADRIVQRMEALHVAARSPDRHIRGVPLTPQQYDDYARIGGRLAKMMLDAVVVPGFEQMPPEQQIKQIHATLTHAHEAAAAQIMMQSIGGENDIMKKATDAKAAALHGASHADVKGILKAH